MKPTEVIVVEQTAIDRHRIVVDRISARIRELLSGGLKGKIEIGQALHRCYSLLGKDEFNRWLRREFSWSQGEASKMMRVSQRFHDLDCLGQFDFGAIYLLSRDAIPEQTVEEVFSRARKGEFFTKSKVQRLLDGQPIEKQHSVQAGVRYVLKGIGIIRGQFEALEEGDIDTVRGEMVALLSELGIEVATEEEPGPAPQRKVVDYLAAAGRARPRIISMDMKIPIEQLMGILESGPFEEHPDGWSNKRLSQ